MPESVTDQFQPTERTRLRRLPKRAVFERNAVYEILDAGFICHVAYTIDGQPYCTPTSYWRDGDRLYWHGSSASRMLRAHAEGIPVCVTVTHVDGLVMARSGFHHSVNYRCVMAIGNASLVTDPAHKMAALKAFMDWVCPGRWDDVRGPNAQELKATKVLTMKLDEVSAKVRPGWPVDDEEDMDLPCWAGVVPLRQVMDPPLTDPDMRSAAEPPGYLEEIKRRLAPPPSD